MAVMGLGTEGYTRVQKETTYGSPLTNTMTDLAVKPGTIANIVIENIENDNIIGTRLRQAPNIGRTICSGSLILNLNPATIGTLLNYAFGAASSAGIGPYTHTWLQEITSVQTDGAIFTLQHAQGSELANQLTSCMIHKINIESDNQGNVLLTAEFIAKTYITNVARQTSWSFSAILPYNFSNVVITEAGLGTILTEAMSIEIDLGLDIERWKLGDATPNRVVFNKIPTATMKLTIDADQQFNDAAWAHTVYDFTITMTSTEIAGGSTPYSFVLEFPGCRLNPETSAENTLERLKHELELICEYGGTTTGSAATNVMWEARVVDATATYTA